MIFDRLSVSTFDFKIKIHKYLLSKTSNTIFKNGWPPRNGLFISILSEVDFRKQLPLVPYKNIILEGSENSRMKLLILAERHTLVENLSLLGENFPKIKRKGEVFM